MKLFPATASPDALMAAVISAFEPHRPLSRAEEQRGDAFTDLCCNLARDGFERCDDIALAWLTDPKRHESLMWIATAAISRDTAEIGRAVNTIADEFVSDRADEYAEDARIKMAEDGDENQ